MTDIEEQAEQLLKDVLEEYYSRDDWDNRSLSEMIDQQLTDYNREVIDTIYNSLDSELSTVFTKELPQVIPSLIEVSDRLYDNATLVGANITQVLKGAIPIGATPGSIATSLYEGYNLENFDLLDVLHEYPKYIQDYLDNPSNAKTLLNAIDKMKTKPLSVATQGIKDAMDKMNEEALEKALDTWLNEKARYYADRIAKTEIQRAKALANGFDILNDGNIEFVKWELSSRHRIFDICDYYAKLDVGYGAGIYPKGKYPSLPLHPFCMCKVVPYYKKVTKKDIKDPYVAGLEKYSDNQQRDILGSWAKVEHFKNGSDPRIIFNASRPNFPLVNIEDLELKPITPEIFSEKMINDIGTWSSTHKDIRQTYYDGKTTDLEDVFNMPYTNTKDIYRGLKFDQDSGDYWEYFATIEPGDTFQDIAPSSWTSSPTIANEFSRADNPYFTSVILKVSDDVPLGYDITDFSDFPSEAEVLIRPRQEFIVKNVQTIEVPSLVEGEPSFVKEITLERY